MVSIVFVHCQRPETAKSSFCEERKDDFMISSISKILLSLLAVSFRLALSSKLSQLYFEIACGFGWAHVHKAPQDVSILESAWFCLALCTCTSGFYMTSCLFQMSWCWLSSSAPWCLCCSHSNHLVQMLICFSSHFPSSFDWAGFTKHIMHQHTAIV